MTTIQDPTQQTLPFDEAAEHLDRCRHYARNGNVDMCNIYLHRYGTAASGYAIDQVVEQLRTLATGRCLHPDAIGDPALFN